MKALYSPLLHRGWLTGLGLLAGMLTAQAQNLNFGTGSAAMSTGTFTSLGTTGTAIVVGDDDDDNSAAQNIGFTFGYNGQAFTQFVLNTNGALKLGSTPPSADFEYFEASTDPDDVNMLFPFHVDLVAASATTSFRSATTGTAPNRVCTIEWSGMREYFPAGSATQFTNFSFQVKLYETTNAIEFVYGPATAGTPDVGFAAVGLKGSGPAAGQVLLATKPETAAATTATFQTTNYTTQAFDYTTTTLPAPGFTFRFTPTVTALQDAQLARAISVFPNPSAGSFTLKVQAAGAQQSLQVEVLNQLGQRVYATTARDNFRTELNLEQLAAGMYQLKVSRGNGFAVSRISIQK
ncbi:T9SS type A sorting domain-containing protein [Hymenobacter gummosus]|uniref:T9SS type A sorting domain-containing protein n=1 Tax=Hymenobacter gummosus TaxID=1776032 RepID=A0A3S0JCV2_9BACT|nr:T9SS type A sorting domain-containing protein [Hymenobacter gummosus]RTQ45002.1 T9SS type A sorting domain-containing protein [Hymenobacter gummosus]